MKKVHIFTPHLQRINNQLMAKNKWKMSKKVFLKYCFIFIYDVRKPEYIYFPNVNVPYTFYQAPVKIKCLISANF